MWRTLHAPEELHQLHLPSARESSAVTAVQSFSPYRPRTWSQHTGVIDLLLGLGVERGELLSCSTCMRCKAMQALVKSNCSPSAPSIWAEAAGAAGTAHAGGLVPSFPQLWAGWHSWAACMGCRPQHTPLQGAHQPIRVPIKACRTLHEERRRVIHQGCMTQPGRLSE